MNPGTSTTARTLQFTLPSKATGARFGFLAQAQLPDTAWPSMPADWLESPDTNITIAINAERTPLYYRNRFAIFFDENTSGVNVRGVLSRHNATVVGGFPELLPRGAYVVSIPDPGPTYADVQAKRASIAAEPGVNLVMVLAYRDYIDVRSRHPHDGPSASLASWFASPSQDPWKGYKEIRAPLGWGCETGQYGSALPKVGIIDLTYDEKHPDLVTSQKVLREPTKLAAFPYLLGDPIKGAIYRSHGTAVAGIVAAQGDNGSGTAGMLWNAKLHLYALGKGQLESANLVPDFMRYMTDARLNGVRVITTSEGVGLASDTNHVDGLRRHLAAYLASGGLFIIAAGNTGTHLSLAALQQGPVGPQVTALDRALALLVNDFPHQIVFAAATDSSNALWAGPVGSSNYWSGAPMLGAPGQDLRVITPTTESNAFPNGDRWASGTSYAAPFVAGLAGQLLAMDPNLTATDVTDYMLRGAQAPRGNPATGQLDPATGVQNAPGVYRVDAFNALALLSRERLGAPICGYPVSVQAIGPYPNTQPEMLLEKGPGAGDTVRYSILAHNEQAPWYVSVGQGGRRIAYYAGRDPTNSPWQLIRAVNQVGQPVASQQTLGYARKIYTQRHIIDVSNTSGGQRVDIYNADGSFVRSWPSFVNASGGQIYAGLETIAASPFGDYMAIPAPTGPSHTTYELHVMGLDGATGQFLAQFDVFPCGEPSACSVNFRNSAWSHDGRSLVFAAVRQTSLGGGAVSYDLMLVRFDVGRSGVSTTFARLPDVIGSDLYPHSMSFSSDDSRLLIQGENAALQCLHTERASNSLQTEVVRKADACHVQGTRTAHIVAGR